MGVIARSIPIVLCLFAFGCRTKEEPKQTTVPLKAPSGSFVGGRVIVKVKPGQAISSGVLARNGLVKVKDLSGGAALYGVEGLDANAPNADPLTKAIVEELRRDPAVAYAELDSVLTIDDQPQR